MMGPIKLIFNHHIIRKERQFVCLPFVQPNIVHAEGAITSDAIGSL